MMHSCFIEDDEFCNPRTPRVIKLSEINGAANRMKDKIRRTPCIMSKYHKDFTMHLYYKFETLQRTGSVAERGVVNYIEKLSTASEKRGIATASLGNFAYSLCYYARKKKIPVLVVMPMIASTLTRHRCHSTGAKVFLHGNTWDDANDYAKKMAQEYDYTYLNSHDHPLILAGYGTVGKEILDDVPFADAILVPTGSGGLLAGIAAYVHEKNPECAVYGVQPKNMCAVFTTLKLGEVVRVPKVGTMADSLSSQHVEVNSYATLQSIVNKVLLVKESWIAKAMLYMYDKEHYVVEGAAACSLAAIIGSLVPELKTKNVVCVMSGANIDAICAMRCMFRGLAANAQLIHMTVKFADNQYNTLMRVLKTGEYTIVDMERNNQWLEGDFFMIEVTISCLCNDLQHGLELKAVLHRLFPGHVEYHSEKFADKNNCPCHFTKPNKNYLE